MSLWRQLTYGLRSLTHRSARDRDVADEVDAGKYFWRSGREKCFSLDTPFNRTSGCRSWVEIRMLARLSHSG
jgi:hypothetical protein